MALVGFGGLLDEDAFGVAIVMLREVIVDLWKVASQFLAQGICAPSIKPSRSRREGVSISTKGGK